MKNFRYILFLFLMVIGCGQQLVEFPLGGPPTVSLTDPVDGAIGVAENVRVHAAFSKGMDASTLNAATFTLESSGKKVTSTVTYAGTTATLVPAGTLATGALYKATITTGAKDFQGTALSADYVWTFTTRDAPDTEAPMVTFTDPAGNDVAVPTGTKIRAAFDEAMNPATIDSETFTVTRAGVPVDGVVAYGNQIATFVPSSALAANSTFTATITTGVEDVAGNALAIHYQWSFSTSDAPPTVSFTDPADMDVAVPVSASIHAAFSAPMDPATITTATFTVSQGGMSVPGVVSYSGLSATFTPTNALAANALITATITTGAMDPVGNALAANYVWTFTTSASPDMTSPAVTFTDPVDQATGVSDGTSVRAAFNETMDCATIDASTFTLVQGTAPVFGVVTCNGTTATFTPSASLTGSPTFTATITTGAKDMNGNGLLQDYVWSFQTGKKAGQAPVALGAASDYAILAFNTVTNVNNPGTIVTGNLGISPGAALIGFPPGQVIGMIHAGDSAAAAAKASLLAAYNDAAGRLGAAVLPADLSGLTFTPGLYAVSTSVMLASGNVTLDAQGDSNAVFVFQIGSTLTTNTSTQVVLSGGAKATNIFWAVGTSATLGTTSIFKGTVLAASAITMKTGAALEGRLLAQAAAVALDTNVITVPAP